MSPTADATLSQRRGDASGPGWEFFDRIYCISLSGRADRRERAEAEFARVGLAGLVEFRIVEKHPTDAEEGIFNSHLECLRVGLIAGGNILVFEDDISFHGFSDAALRDAIEFLREDQSWQIFFFGCFVRSSRPTPFKSVLEIKFKCLAHAYVVTRGFAESLVKERWSGVAYDDLLRGMIEPGRAYALYPSFAFQSGSKTDNHKTPNVDRARRLLGGVRLLQRWNEFSARRLVPLVVVHILVVAIIAVIAVLVRKGIVHN